MSELRSTRDRNTSDEIAIAGAVALLAKAARKDLPSVKAQLAAAGFDLAPIPKPNTGTSRHDTIGQLVAGRGVHLGSWSFDPKYDPVEVYSADDFLRDKSGKQLVLTFHEAVEELTSRNHGRRYGNGTEAALRQALREGKYQDGDLVLAPREILNGYDYRDQHIRPGNNVCDLLRTSPAFEKLFNTVKNRSGDGRWSVSGSVSPGGSGVWAVRLTDGAAHWDGKGSARSGVVPVRLFSRANSQPGPAG